MAFAMTKFVAHGTEVEECINKRYIQRVVLEITSTTADVALDVGTAAGTFWTAVGVAAGSAGAKAVQALKDITSKAVNAKCCRASIDGLIGRVPAAAASGAAYVIAQDTYGPSWTFAASNGLSGAAAIVIEWILKDGEEPVQLAV